MAGVWVFRNGVAKLVQNPMVEPIDGHELSGAMSTQRRKALVYLPTMEIICSYPHLEEKLLELGWIPYTDPSAASSTIASSCNPHHRSATDHVYNDDDDLLHIDNRPAFSEDHHHHHHHHQQQQHHGSIKHHHSHRHQNHHHHHHHQDQEDESKQLVQFHRCFSSSLLISLPRDFSKFKTMHMYDIVLKNRQYFEVRDCSNYQ